MKHNIGRIKRRVGRAINTKYYRYKFHNTSLIGENTVVSEYCKLYSHGHKGNPNNPAAPYTLKIGDDVWIGAGCIVLPSVEFIENGSVIPAGTVVR
jgi:acetyltransferase-like isoleucine patch superfamily enzyme